MDPTTEQRLKTAAAHYAELARNGTPIIIPRPHGAGGGVVRVRDMWCASLVAGKTRKQISLGVCAHDEALVRRGRFLDMLREAGALTGSALRGKEHIYDTTPRKPFLVKVGQTVVGRYATREEAVAARDIHLATLEI